MDENGSIPLGHSDTPKPASADHRYEITDRTGLSMGVLPLPTLLTLIRQGRLFPSDRVTRDADPTVTLAELPEFHGIFEESLPPEFQVGGAVMRPKPDLAGLLDRGILATVFARIFTDGRTGRMFLVSDGRQQEKVIIFQRGIPVNAMSNIPDEQLGEMLITNGAISADIFERAVDQRREVGGRLGSALIALDALSPLALHRALSVQAMERLLNAFRQPSGTFRFVPDDAAAKEEILIFASSREVIEAGLHASLSAAEIIDELHAYGAGPIIPKTEVIAGPWGKVAIPGDADVLALAQRAVGIDALCVMAAERLRLTLQEAQLKVLTLVRVGLLGTAEKQIDESERHLAALHGQHYFDQLGVSRTVTTPDVAAAHQRALASLGALPQSGDLPVVARNRERIKSILDTALRTLSAPDLRGMYERALQLGLDFEQPQVRARVQLEHHVGRGKQLLAQQRFAEARSEFQCAVESSPEEPLIYVHLGWSTYLGSAGDASAAAEAIRVVERALRLSSESDQAHMTIGKIYRLSGDLKQAESYLRRAIAINPHNNEAQSELRLIFTRDIFGRTPGKVRSLKLESSLLTTLLVAFAAIVTVFGVSHGVPGDLTEWPEAIRPSLNYLNVVPKELPEYFRTISILEYFYVPDDGFWWGRRIGLLIFAFIGMRVAMKSFRPGPFWGTNPVWVAVAVPYGMAIGFLSPVPFVVPELPVLLGMTAFHVVVEELFFGAFLTRALLKEYSEGLPALPIVGLAFGLYHLSYLFIFHEPTGQMIQDVLQIGTFAGVAYAVLYWKSGGLFAPILAHLLVNGTMMIRSHFLYHV